MKNCEGGCFSNCTGGIIFGRKDLIAEAAQLAATIKRDFEELKV